MAIVVVGGQTKDIGKTSVVAGIIATMPEMRWTAIKIRQSEEPVCAGEGCECVTAEHTVAAREEREAGSGTDTSRYLAAGAVRAFWVRVQAGRMAEAMPWIGKELAAVENAVIESNSILEFLRPEIYLSVLEPGMVDFKDSARLYLERADAVLVPLEAVHDPEWRVFSSVLHERTKVFAMEPPVYCTDEILDFVRSLLALGR